MDIMPKDVARALFESYVGNEIACKLVRISRYLAKEDYTVVPIEVLCSFKPKE